MVERLQVVARDQAADVVGGREEDVGGDLAGHQLLDALLHVVERRPLDLDVVLVLERLQDLLVDVGVPVVDLQRRRRSRSGCSWRSAPRQRERTGLSGSRSDLARPGSSCRSPPLGRRARLLTRRQDRGEARDGDRGPPARRRKSRRLIGCGRRPGAIGTVASSCAGAGLTGGSDRRGEYHRRAAQRKVADGPHRVHPSLCGYGRQGRRGWRGAGRTRGGADADRPRMRRDRAGGA